MTVFPKGAWHALDSACDLGYNVVGMDWLQDAKDAVRIRGDRKVVFQGNADPGVLYGTKEAITKAVQEMVDGFWVGNQGWIANLGHGKSGSDRHQEETIGAMLTVSKYRHNSRRQPRQPRALFRRGSSADKELTVTCGRTSTRLAWGVCGRKTTEMVQLSRRRR